MIGRRRAHFFLGLGPSPRSRGFRQEAGGQLIGEAAKAIVDLEFELGETGGIPIQSVE